MSRKAEDRCKTLREPRADGDSYLLTLSDLICEMGSLIPNRLCGEGKRMPSDKGLARRCLQFVESLLGFTQGLN